MIRAASLLVTAVALVAGCGDDEDSERARPPPTVDETPRDEQSGGSSVGRADRDTDVGIRDYRFVPSRAIVAQGARVEWNNYGDVAHTVTWTGGGGERFDSGRIEPGERFERTFAASGAEIRYRCTIHPLRMRGIVEVGT